MLGERMRRWGGTSTRFVSPWRVALTTTEFIIHPDLASELDGLERGVEAMRLPSQRIVGNDSHPLLRFESLIRQRSLIILREWITQYSRFVHRLRHSPAAPNPYALGRHGMSQHRVKIDESNVQECAHGWIAKFAYSPWPECLQRKLQIGKRIPKDHLERRMGTQHNTTVEKLSQERNASIAQSFELATAEPFADDPRLRMALHALYSVTRVALIFNNSAMLMTLRSTPRPLPRRRRFGSRNKLNVIQCRLSSNSTNKTCWVATGARF